MKNIFASLLLLVSMSLFIGGCNAAPKTAEEKEDIVKESGDALAAFKKADPSIVKAIDSAYGYAVFPKIGKGGVGIGGAAGKGVVYEHGKPIGYCSMTQATIGLQLGGQTYKQLILFENQKALNNFTGSNWEMSAQATAVAAASGSAATAKYSNGVMVFVTGMEGLMGEASLGGQKFKYERMGS